METEIKALTADLKSCIRAVKRNILVIVFVMLSAMLLGFLIGMSIDEDSYEAKATIYCATEISYEQSMVNDKILSDCVDIAESNSVLERACLIIGDSALTVDKIRRMIEVDHTSGSSVITVSAKTSNQAEAVNVTNAVADSLVIELQNLIGSDTIQILDRANGAEEGLSAFGLRMIIIVVAAVFGFAIPCFIFCMCVLLSGKVKTVEDCELGGKLKVLGVIPAIEK